MPPGSTFDVYRDWLGIQETAQPLNHYQLLRIKLFEDNTSKYPQRYRRMTGHVRKVAEADHPELAEKVIRELIDAMLCLSDARRKLDYDRRLGRPEDGRPNRRTFERALLDFQAIDPLELNKAKNFALAVGFELRDALIQRKLAPQEVIMMAYAESVGLPYLSPIDIRVDPALIEKVPDFLARKNSCVPLRVVDDLLLVLSPFPLTPQVAEQLHERTDLLAHMVLCAPHVVGSLLAKHYLRSMPARRTPALAAVAADEEASAGLRAGGDVGGEVRRSAAATALAEMKDAWHEPAEDESRPAVPKVVRQLIEDAKQAQLAAAKHMRLAATLAVFSLSASLYQVGYGVYLSMNYWPYSLKMYWLGWPVALVVAGIGWVVAGFFLSR